MIGHRLNSEWTVVAAAPSGSGDYVVLAVSDDRETFEPYVTALVSVDEMPTPTEWFWGTYRHSLAAACEDFLARMSQERIHMATAIERLAEALQKKEVTT